MAFSLPEPAVNASITIATTQRRPTEGGIPLSSAIVGNETAAVSSEEDVSRLHGPRRSKPRRNRTSPAAGAAAVGATPAAASADTLTPEVAVLFRAPLLIPRGLHATVPGAAAAAVVSGGAGGLKPGGIIGATAFGGVSVRGRR